MVSLRSAFMSCSLSSYEGKGTLDISGSNS